METQSWRFGAAESLLILKGAGVSGAEVLKLALTELVAGGQLSLEPGRKPLLRRGLARSPARRQSLRAVMEIFERLSATQDEVEVARLAKAVRGQYGSLAKYRDREVLAGLVDEGLFVSREQKVLWVFTQTRHEATFAGQDARRRLEELRGRLEADPAAVAPAAGAAILLMPALFPALGELDRRRNDGADGSYLATGAASGSGGSGESEHVGVPDAPNGLEPSATPTPVPSFDTSSFDFSSLDFGALDGALSAIDAGVSSDSGGGGDGGGGDGGGGGSSD